MHHRPLLAALAFVFTLSACDEGAESAADSVDASFGIGKADES